MKREVMTAAGEVIGHISNDRGDPAYYASYKGTELSACQTLAGAELAVFKEHDRLMSRGIVTSAPAHIRDGMDGATDVCGCRIVKLDATTSKTMHVFGCSTEQSVRYFFARE